jgi:hypothetical protein
MHGKSLFGWLATITIRCHGGRVGSITGGITGIVPVCVYAAFCLIPAGGWSAALKTLSEVSLINRSGVRKLSFAWITGAEI